MQLVISYVIYAITDVRLKPCIVILQDILSSKMSFKLPEFFSLEFCNVKFLITKSFLKCKHLRVSKRSPCRPNYPNSTCYLLLLTEIDAKGIKCLFSRLFIASAVVVRK